MSKIGLITFFESDNFGTCLQAMALQNKIKSLGYDCDIIKNDYNVGNVKNELFLNKIYDVIKNKGLGYFIDLLKSTKYLKCRREIFSNFREQYFHIVTIDDDFNGLKDVDDKYDVFVCGSDMMWSEESLQKQDKYFLRFTDKSKRIAYAPSFGSGEISEDNFDLYSKHIRGINYLSCREKSGVELIKKMTGLTAKLVVDPTLFLSRYEWINFLDVKKCDYNQKYILIYTFDSLSKEKKKHIDIFARKYGYLIYFMPGKYGEYKKMDSNGYKAIGPKEYVELYANAEFVITDGYHGLIFSLIFNKPFIIYHRGEGEYWGKYEDRMAAMIKLLGLEERYLYENQEINFDFVKLDYTEINIKLDNLISESEIYLRKSIESAVNSSVK